jgi:glycolate oxidase FAD binding subunit
VVKNVAGYDLPKLFIGAFGTLGVIVEATFKVTPLPQESATVTEAFSNAESAFSVALRLLRSPLLPSAADILSPAVAGPTLGIKDRYVLIVRFGGLRGAIERQQRDIDRWSREEAATDSAFLGEDNSLWDRVRDFASQHETVLKIGALPTQLSRIAARAEELAQERDLTLAWIAHAFGIMLVAPAGADDAVALMAEALRTEAIGRGGHLIVLCAPRSFRERVPVWGPARSDFAIMARLKRELDPEGILNPGRLGHILA